MRMLRNTWQEWKDSFVLQHVEHRMHKYIRLAWIFETNRIELVPAPEKHVKNNRNIWAGQSLKHPRGLQTQGGHYMMASFDVELVLICTRGFSK